MKNDAIARLEPLVGKWNLVMTNAWFLDNPEEPVEGWASFEWLDDSFIVFRWAVDDTPPAVEVIGYSDPQERFQAFYHDDRGVARIFDMEFDGSQWTLLRQDPDFHQRFVAEIDDDSIIARAEASEDEGATWRKDFDLTFTRKRD